MRDIATLLARLREREAEIVRLTERLNLALSGAILAEADLQRVRGALEHKVHSSTDVSYCSFTWGGPNFVEQDAEDGCCRYEPHWRPCNHCAEIKAAITPDRPGEERG